MTSDAVGWSGRDPLPDLPRADRAWVRARVPASAPVAPTQPLLIGLVLAVEGVVLAGVAVSRARTAHRWLSLYAHGSAPSPVMRT